MATPIARISGPAGWQVTERTRYLCEDRSQREAYHGGHPKVKKLRWLEQLRLIGLIQGPDVDGCQSENLLKQVPEVPAICVFAAGHIHSAFLKICF